MTKQEKIDIAIERSPGSRRSLAWAVKNRPTAMASTHGHAARRKRASELWAISHPAHAARRKGSARTAKDMANLKKKLRGARVDKHARSKRRKGSFAKTVKKLGITNKKKDLPKVAWSRGDGMATIDNDKNKSWRDEYEEIDIDTALRYAGLSGPWNYWTYEVWDDGDIQFVADGMQNSGVGIPFDDLAKLRITFTPIKMVVQALVEEIGGDPKLYVTMSWNGGMS